jgi:hypothetical protein
MKLNNLTGEKSMITEAQINEAHAQATVSRGPRKGRLKHQCPPMGTLAAAYWQGAAAGFCTHKLGIAHLMWFTDEQREMFDIVREQARAIRLRKMAA